MKHTSLVRQVHKVQILQSPRAGPVANVMQVAPPTAASNQTEHKYTDNPLEMVRTHIPVDPLTLPALLQKAWPELKTDGARLITAQFMSETGRGNNCWNYNLGNVKCTSKRRESHLHQYLVGTWEYWAASLVEATLQKNKNSRLATPAEIKSKVGKEGGGKKIIFFKPPAIECCFLAYKSLGDGVIEWTNRYKVLAKRFPDLLGQLNKSDYAAFAKVLHKTGYYSQDESTYAASMKTQKEHLDRTLNKK